MQSGNLVYATSPPRNPACSSLSNASKASFSLPRITLHRTLPTILSSIMPHQFLQRLKSPFFGNLIKSPSFQSLGISSSFQILFRNLCRTSTVIAPPSFKASGGTSIFSNPGAFPFFSFFSTTRISAFVMLPILMGKSGPGGTTGEVYRLRTVKCFLKVLFPPLQFFIKGF